VHSENPILTAAQARKARVQFLTPTHLSSVDVSYETDGNGRVLFISDQIEGSPSLGTSIFSEKDLAKHLWCEATSVVMSAEPNEAHERFAAALLLAANDPRLVVVLTGPKHHAEWANKITKLSGTAPLMHVASEDADLSSMQSLYIDLRRAGAKEFVN
jgi:hypothetical protein